ncbi:dermonecrotic toxin domain-containing protein [Pseudomonas monachiensis]|uniref:Dermonecrotic toxin domain-containing protein n=1 Tax=Pseudomonas monachiensis TaxID=3060212 RepID=A0ABW9HC55_9PSED
MSTPVTPLFFPEALTLRGRWKELGKTHGLTQKDFEWFSHIELATQALRDKQTPPMLVKNVLLKIPGLEPVVLAGSFVLTATPDDNGLILYTPYAGIKKFANRTALTDHLVTQLKAASEDDDLLAFMAVSQRKAVVDAGEIVLDFQPIDDDVFEDQRKTLSTHQQLNDQALLDELKVLPSLTSLLDTLLNQKLAASFPGLDQSQTQVNFYQATTPENADESHPARRWVNSLSLSEAVLLHYRHQLWPAGQSHEFLHPEKSPANADQPLWEAAVTTISRQLISLLVGQLEGFWAAPSADGASRREFFGQAIADQARVQLLLKREAEIITPEQSQDLHALISTASRTNQAMTVETVRLWEYKANYVELAGSLMVSTGNAFLYTPTAGLQVLKDYKDLCDTVRSKFSAAGHEDELYGLLSLDERQRFIGFDQPNVTGEAISGEIFPKLFDGIIGKQRQNMQYALQVFRHSDGTVDIHALFDKALDIRSMINERLLTLATDGRWSTRPVLSGDQHPSTVLAHTAATFAKSFNDIETPFKTDFAAQPVAALALQRVYLENMKPRLAHALSVGLRGEANMRVLGATLRDADRAIVETVFNPDRADRQNRPALNGFRPDAYSLTLECSGQRDVLPLAHCLLLTERGGLDPSHSGRTILWTPAEGLEVFDNISRARLELNRRLLEPQQRLALLENLTPAQRFLHQRYSLGPLRLIEGSVLERVAQSSIEHFLARCEHVRIFKLSDTKRKKALKDLTTTVLDTNLQRARSIALAIGQQQSLPAWLGMAPLQDLRLHLELLEQYRNSVVEDKDYLHGIKPLKSYVHETLKSLLADRFPATTLDPDKIQITPDLALVGPARSLTEFALHHVNITQGTGFKVGSATTQTLPAGLDQAAVRQLLLLLKIAQNYAKHVTDNLSNNAADVEQRILRFVKQLPWQLLQHAHELKLQQRLSDSAFDLLRQVFDMPDAIARATVEGAHAIARPLELIKTTGAAAVKALGLYLIGPGEGKAGPQILYAPYHPSGSPFVEFDNEASVVAALNTPGPLQEMLLRRLPTSQQTVFRNLLKSTVGQSSEITLASSPINGNLLTHLFHDNTRLLEKMLGSQANATAQSDWEAVKHLFSSGIERISGLLPGKLAYVQFLWRAYKDAKNSAEALQDHHWTTALREFIAGAAQIVSLGRLSLEGWAESAQATSEAAAQPAVPAVIAQPWSQVRSTAQLRTRLRRFETTTELKDLTKSSTDGTYLEAGSKKTFAAIAGKVYGVNKTGAVWRMVKGEQEGPVLLATPGKQLVIDPDAHTVHFGKAVSKMRNQYVNAYVAREVLNIEARGMEEIRARHPEKARMIVQAIDMARYYAFNSLHNLVQLRELVPGTRLDTFLKQFFDVDLIDKALLDKIRQAVVPICNALVDPDEDWMNSQRFIVGSSRDPEDNLVAFVVDKDQQRNVHFTENFFDQQLDWYKSSLTQPFDVDGHSQAATLIHEFAHLFSGAVDIAYLEARLPFSDLVASVTGYGAAKKQSQVDFQREALSMKTPKDELFARWNSGRQLWVNLDSIPSTSHIGKKILQLTGSETMAKAREAFFNVRDSKFRTDVILHNADSVAFLICEMGRQLDPVPVATPPAP